MFARNGVFRTYSSVILYLFRFLDLLVLIGTGILAHYFIFQYLPQLPLQKSLILINVFFFLMLADRVHLYVPMRGKNASAEIYPLAIIGVFLSIILIPVALYLNESKLVGSQKLISWILLWNVFVISTLMVLRIAVRSVLRICRSHGFNQRRILLVGANPNAANVENEVEKCPEHGLIVSGYLDDRDKIRDQAIMNSTYLGKTDDILKVVNENKIDQVWITYPMKGEERVKALVDVLKFETTSIRYVIDTAAFKYNKKTITNFANIPLLDIDVSPMDGPISSNAKKIEDILGSSIILLILSPLFLLIAIGVKLSSPGPVFYRQTRISWNNKPFGMLKFRSMPVDAEKNTGPKWASSGENRATKFGSFLRKTSLDELPQFINVLKGDMSIVGPRPERPEFVEEFKESIPDYMKKHMVKAGITGWAQINGYRGDTDLQKRIEYDMEYIKHWSLLFDLQIAVETVFKGLIHKNAY